MVERNAMVTLWPRPDCGGVSTPRTDVRWDDSESHSSSNPHLPLWQAKHPSNRRATFGLLTSWADTDLRNMKLETKIHPEEIEQHCRSLIAEISAQRDDAPINKTYFIARIREDMSRSMNHAFSSGRIFERRNPVTQ